MTNPDHAHGRFSDLSKSILVLCVTAAIFGTSMAYGFNLKQALSVSIFAMVVAGTLSFWDFHLPIAFVGVSLLMFTDVLRLPDLITSSKLDLILFMAGMMVVMGILRELGLFSWIIMQVISIEGMSAKKFIFITCFVGMMLSGMIDEITGIVLVAALIFQVCDALDIKPVPFIIMAVMTVNIGSAGLMLANPVSILVGQNANPSLGFNDFIIWSFPLMLIEFLAMLAFMMWSFRRDIRAMDDGFRDRRERGLSLGPVIQIPVRQSLTILIILMASLAAHHFLEDRFGLPRNTVLITMPLFMAGVLMLFRREHIHKYMEHDVEWTTIIYLMMLFVAAGTFETTGVTDIVVDAIHRTYGNEANTLTTVVLLTTSILSACCENVIFIASFMPIVVRLEHTPLLFALLHGTCIGGNITMIGSTSNIAAVSMVEKRYWTLINFFTWMKTGLCVGVICFILSWGWFTVMSPYMPTYEQRVKREEEKTGRKFVSLDESEAAQEKASQMVAEK